MCKFAIFTSVQEVSIKNTNILIVLDIFSNLIYGVYR